MLCDLEAPSRRNAAQSTHYSYCHLSMRTLACYTRFTSVTQRLEAGLTPKPQTYLQKA